MSSSADPPPGRHGDGSTDLPPLLSEERDRIIVRLKESVSRDELSLEEYERQISRVYGARTRAELEGISSDLPVRSVPDAELAAARLQVRSILSSIVRSGLSVLPKRVWLRSWAGNIEIDFTRSQVQPGVTEIHVDVVLGNVEITLPSNVHIDDQTNVVLSSFDNPRPRGAAEPLPSGSPPLVVRLQGRVILGNLSVRFR